MPIGTLNISRTNDFFYTPQYKTLIRSLKEILLTQTSSLPIPNPSDRYAYRYDFYRLLRTVGVKSHLYWTVAYLNGVEDLFRDNSHIVEILNIDEQIILDIISRSNTRQG